MEEENALEDGAGNTRGLLQAAKKIYRTAGPLSFFKDLQARVLYQIPAAAICWSTYEFFKFILKANRGGSGGGSRTRSSGIVATADLVKNEKNLSDQWYVLSVSAASTEASSSMIVRTGSSSSSSSSPKGSSSSERDCGRRELPAMSGAGIYDVMSFNTMHSTNTAADHHQLR